ncbi:MAG TPA: hypothetical protein VJ803_06115 [Gemmatimonadaceae bacterium]|nr:hypothetical protein [Gemmatimonadaceae bacterium]
MSDDSPGSPEPRLFYADVVYDHIRQEVRAQEKALEPGQALAVEVLLLDGSVLSVVSFGFHNPNFVTVDGFNQKGVLVHALVQHTQIQVLIAIVSEKEARARQIGFPVPPFGGGQ